VFPAREAVHTVARPGIAGSRRTLLFGSVTIAVVLRPSIAPAELLRLTSTDNSDGRTSVIIQRATSTTGPYMQVVQVAGGVVASGGFTLSAAKTGSGARVVASSPAGINCGIACTYTYETGTLVTVAGTPSAGSMFRGRL
jgi:hypothetical protein